jgi:hypothetical protein
MKLSGRVLLKGQALTYQCKTKTLRSIPVVFRQFSATPETKPKENAPAFPTNNTKEVLIYTGMFAGKMKWLRRVSLTSTVLSMFFLVSSSGSIVLCVFFLYHSDYDDIIKPIIR